MEEELQPSMSILAVLSQALKTIEIEEKRSISLGENHASVCTVQQELNLYYSLKMIQAIVKDAPESQFKDSLYQAKSFKLIIDIAVSWYYFWHYFGPSQHENCYQKANM